MAPSVDGQEWTHGVPQVAAQAAHARARRASVVHRAICSTQHASLTRLFCVIALDALWPRAARVRAQRVDVYHGRCGRNGT